jgi:hypothetical protein
MKKVGDMALAILFIWLDCSGDRVCPFREKHLPLLCALLHFIAVCIASCHIRKSCFLALVSVGKIRLFA